MLNNMMSFRKYTSSRRCSAERLMDNRKILVGTPAAGHNSAFFFQLNLALFCCDGISDYMGIAKNNGIW